MRLLNLNPNMSGLDRSVRIVLGCLLIILGPLGVDIFPSVLLGWFCTVFGLANILASIFCWCPMYRAIGISSLLVGRGQKASDKDDSSIESNNSLRKKTVFGFGVITLLVSLVFIFESRGGALSIARLLEIEQLHEKTRLFEQLLAQNIFRSDDELALAIHEAGLALMAVIENGQERIVQTDLDDQTRIFLTAEAFTMLEQALIDNVHDEHHRHNDDHHYSEDHHHREEIYQDIDDFILSYEGNTYFIMAHAKPNLPALVLIQPSTSQAVVGDYVLKRLVWTSVIVIWMGLWAGYGVALFIWRRIEQSHRHIVKAANTDPGTKLPNERSVKVAFTEKQQVPEFSKMQVHVYDCRSYQNVLMDHGSDMAHQLMVVMADRLRQTYPKDAMIGRLNDGNIMVITPHSTVNAGKESNEVMAVLEDSVQLGNYRFALEPSKVRLEYPKDADNFDDIVKYAALTMSKAHEDKVKVLPFAPDVLYRNNKKYQYASELGSALSHGDLELYFQPKINLKTNKADSVESLIRWNHKDDGLLLPGAFLEIIEESNVRADFCLFVMQRSVDACLALRENGFDVSVAFNMNSYDAVSPLIQQSFVQIVKASGLPFSALQIELTEGETTINIEQIITALTFYSELGCKIAIDDFGMGMSSLSYCHRLPAHVVKIDRSFVQGLTSQRESQVVVKAIMEIAENLQWQVVAEGVETSDVADILVELECDYAQGYLYARPMPYDTLIEYLQQHQ